MSSVMFDVRLRIVSSFPPRRSSRIKCREMRQHAKSGARTKKARSLISRRSILDDLLEEKRRLLHRPTKMQPAIAAMEACLRDTRQCMDDQR